MVRDIIWRFVTAGLLGALALAPCAASHAFAQPAREGDRPVRISRGLLHEGAFLADQPGRLIQLDQGGAAFVFDRNSEGRATPPMALLPCTTLMRMEQISEARENDVRFRLSGQVFTFRDRNYLLPTFYKVASSEEAPPAAPVELEDDPAESDDPTVEELIESIEALTFADLDSDAENSISLPSADLMADSTFLRPRRGVIIRGAAGALSFAINNDVDVSGGFEAPMPILPCQSLALIERLLDEHGAESTFIISGRVFLYRGQNYLLPVMVQLQLDRSSGLTSAQ